MDKWKILSSKLAFDHRWFKVRQDEVQLPNGKILDDYFLWLDTDVALVVPITADRKFVFVRQYKHGAADLIIEFPAGYIDEGEAPLDAARRELREETGFQASTFQKIGRLVHNSTKAVGSIHVYLAEQLAEAQLPPQLDGTEEIELLHLPFEDVYAMIDRGEVLCSSSISAFYLASAKLGLLQPAR
jgi:ADP-ribose pyrophosphatase